MGKRSKGFRSRTRPLMKKRSREAGKKGLSRILYKYEPNERVLIKIDPSHHKGMPHRRFQGKIGVIRSVKGRSYIVEVSIGKIKKNIITHPIHFRPLGE